MELAEDKRLVTGLDWTDPDSTVELAEDKWTEAVQRSRSIDLELCTRTDMYYPICIWVGGSYR